MRKILAIAILSVCLASFSALAVDTDIAKLADMSGEVSVKVQAAAEWTVAKAGQVLNKSDFVKTGADSYAIIEFADKSTVALKANTEIFIEDLVWTEDARKVGINMTIGELRTIVKKLDKPSQFTVRTPTAISGARGTIFYIMYDGNNTRVFVTEGSVDFSNANGENTYVVIENMSAIASSDGTVSEPRELTGEEKEQALAGWTGPIAEPYSEPGGMDTTLDDIDNPDVTTEDTASRT